MMMHLLLTAMLILSVGNLNPSYSQSYNYESYQSKLSSTAWNIPSFCINKHFHSLITKRFPDLTANLIIAESYRLRSNSANEYFRSFDLYAYYYFVLLPNNPYRQDSCENAYFEYIPILSFYWRPYSGYTKAVNMSSLVQDIVSFMKIDEKSSFKRFTVVSAYNFRTLLGTGMPTQVRRGAVWNTVMNFVQSLSIGHYERYPQCPDLLRKSWNYIVELPYIGINTRIDVESESQNMHPKTKELFFAGRFDLIGPEIVCSTRNAIASLASIPNTLIVNITMAEAKSAIQPKIFQEMRQSKFCLITKADSYSSSSFYHALQALCIPIVISDWFVFSFPWLIPYDDFIIRVSEQEFLKNPQYIIKSVLKLYSGNRRLDMVAEMQKWRPLLSFDPLRSDSSSYQNMKSLILSQQLHIAEKKTDTAKFSDTLIGATLHMMSSSSNVHVSFLPFELMLLELNLRNGSSGTVLPCISPFECTPYGKSIYANAMKFDKNEVKDTRSHLCQHNSRLIGHYKIVYFMQCVRVLWPLQPGKLKPVDKPKDIEKNIDSGLPKLDYKFVMDFHNLSDEAKSRKWKYPDMYPPIAESNSKLIVPILRLH
jgi:hypothetical protein